MDRVNKLLTDHNYLRLLGLNSRAEENRIFCRHSMDHLLAVARLTYLLLLENGETLVDKELAYAAALLHDIGRHEEYSTGVDHALKSAELAGPLLLRAGFSVEERDFIGQAIAQHRVKDISPPNRSPLSAALSKADQLSRACFACSAKTNCRTIIRQPHKERLEY